MSEGTSGAGLTEVVTLRVGEEFELVLPGLGTAGYRWSETVDGHADAVHLAWRRGFAPGDERRPVGASAPERLAITATSPGRVTLRLAQRRPWEDGRPRAERTVEVEVLPSAQP